MLAEDQFKRVRPVRWKKNEKPEYKLTVNGVSREDERTLRATAKAMGLSFSVFFSVLAAAFRDHRVIFLPDGAKLDELIDERLIKRIDTLVSERVREIVADANIQDGYMR